MTKIVRTWCVFLLLMGHGAVFADIFDHPLTEQSAVQFQAVCTALSSHSLQKGDFTQTKYIAKLNRNLISSGTYIISQNNGIAWQTKKPFPSVMAVTKTGIIQTSASGRKTTLDANGNATFTQLSAIMSAVFQGNADVLAEHFTVYFTGSPTDWNTALVPQDATLRQMIASIDMHGADALSSITMHEPNGDFVRYEFANQSFPATLTEDEKALFASN